MKMQPHHPGTCTRQKKGRQPKGKIVKISPTIGPVVRLGCCAVLVKVVADWTCQVVGEVSKKWWGKNPWENPQNTKSIGFIFTLFQVRMPRFLPWSGELHTASCSVVDHGTLQEPLTPSKTTQLPITPSAVALFLAQYGPSAEMNTVRPHANVLVLPLWKERDPHNPVVCAREGNLE